ncbi:MAG: helix-turn-helix domain-containing protein [Helicobacteraceae bacterium]|jgi:excisionase family DNA binding protein|nr:helix-turn-helix domain-containing protein [Helicobacteraceae bacterium]
MTKQEIIAEIKERYNKKSVLSKIETASYLGISVTTIDRLISAGKGLSYIDAGGHKKFHASHIADYLIANETRAA